MPSSVHGFSASYDVDKYGDGREWDTTAIGVWIKQGIEVRRQWKLVSVQLDSKEAAEKHPILGPLRSSLEKTLLTMASKLHSF